MTRTSCIIPAYNERERIGSVLTALVGHPLIDEIIVVDDGSTDATGDAVSAFPSVRLITQKKNGGKSRAIADGVRASTGAFLGFIDADLVGLTASDVTALIEPVLYGKAETTISLRHDSLLPWRLIGLDYLSGERVMPRQAIENHLSTIASLTGFGLESFLNDLLIMNKSRIKVVWWPGVGHTYKMTKYGKWKGFLGEVRMIANILETVSLIGTAHQIILMHRAKVK